MAEEEVAKRAHEPGHELHLGHEDRTIRALHRVIRVAVKVLAVLMVLVIVLGIDDVIYVLYQRLTEPPFMLLPINDILATFEAFLAALIATALMAIARKVIIFDFERITPAYIYGTAPVVLALGLTYWLITKRS